MSSLKFGTSGLRGLAVELAGAPAFQYTLAFIDHLIARGDLATGGEVLIAQDLRPSSPEIAQWCAAAMAARGVRARNLGTLMTPALALACQNSACAGIMVTGSHIPDDRNGLKFYRPDGEIDKHDETAIINAYAALDEPGHVKLAPMGLVDENAADDFVARYRDCFGGALGGLKVGLYQHSSVAREMLATLLENAGAKVTLLGHSDIFVPVDTEALRPEDVVALAQWASEHAFDAIVSTDGDADRPLVTDAKGQFVAGDIIGALTALYLGAGSVVTPVTSNSALESVLASSSFIRTKVGSPYVISGMKAANAGPVLGFEANGGVLLGSDIVLNGHAMRALPTRDCVLPILCALASIKQQGKPLAAIVSNLNMNAKFSDRAQDYPRATSAAFMDELKKTNGKLRGEFADLGVNEEYTLDETDGLKFSRADGQVSLHVRPSGNAPELRVYCEAGTAENAKAMGEGLLQIARDFAAEFAGN